MQSQHFCQISDLMTRPDLYQFCLKLCPHKKDKRQKKAFGKLILKCSISPPDRNRWINCFIGGLRVSSIPKYHYPTHSIVGTLVGVVGREIINDQYFPHF